MLNTTLSVNHIIFQRFGAAMHWVRTVNLNRIAGLGALLAVLLAGSACSTAKSAAVLDGRQALAEELNLDPMLIRAGPDGEVSEMIDVRELFELAYEAFSERRYERAADHYGAVVKYFPESSYYLPALYNAGLSYEKLDQWDAAATSYRQILDSSPETKDALDASFRLANAYDKSGQHNQVVDLMTEVLLGKEIKYFDRVEAYVRRGNALRGLEQWSESEDDYRTVLKLNKSATPRDRLAGGSNLMVQTYFGLGRTFHAQVREIKLILPPDRMGDDLVEKARLFTSAQANYIEALRHHHPQWSMGAGFMIGKLYEDFYADIFNAEIPDTLSDEQVALYFEELRKQIRPLMERAIDVYERNLSLSKRMGIDAETDAWVSQTTMKLNRLRSFLEDPITQRRAEILVAHGRKLKHPWDPKETAIDLVSVAIQQASTAVLKAPAAKTDSPSKPNVPKS